MKIADAYSRQQARAEEERQRQQDVALERQIDELPRAVVLAQVQKNLKGLSSALIHDLRQLLATIYQNMNFILAQKYGDGRALSTDFPGLLSPAPTPPSSLWVKEKAVFYTCELMIARMESAKLLTDGYMVERDEKWFAPHRLLVKLIRIYTSVASELALDFGLEQNWHECWASERFAQVALLNVLDNAVKYAPVHSSIRISFVPEDATRSLKVVFESLGPKLQAGEEDAIFRPGTRGVLAKKMKDGSGIGLWQATVSLAANGRIEVRQDAQPDRRFPKYHRTVFTITYFKAQLSAAAEEGVAPRSKGLPL